MRIYRHVRIDEGDDILTRALPLIPGDLTVLALPVQAIGKSNEHIWAKGTITHTATNLIDGWTQIGLEVARAGIKKIVFIKECTTRCNAGSFSNASGEEMRR